MCAVSLPLPARDAFLTSYCDGATSYVYGTTHQGLSHSVL